jgi:hypothetical protein
MKVILSRKGFDSQYGGPILDGEGLVSLPIKYEKERLRRYSEVRCNGSDLGRLIPSLHPHIAPDDFCHLDPDLREESLPRESGWKPLFGQAAQAASHLIDLGVGPGDLFLFFGLFRESDGWRRFRRAAPKRHVIWGWLQVEEVIHDPVAWARTNSWAQSHPHTRGNWTGRNVLFVGKSNLVRKISGSAETLPLPGSGVFRRYSERLCLSDPDSASPSRWRLPLCLKPDLENGKTISYLERGVWSECVDTGYVHMNPGFIRKWQEAVIGGNEAAGQWAINLISDLAAA